MKTEGEVAERARRQARCYSCSRVLGFMAVVSLWTPLMTLDASPQRWFSLPNIYYPVAGAGGDRARRLSLLALDLQRGAMRCRSSRAIGLFLLGYIGPGDLLVSLSRAARR